MKLKKEFVTHELGEEQIMVSASGTFNGFLKSNKTAAYIVELLKNEITKEEIVSKMLEKFDAPEEVISKDVEKILEVLRKVGALDE